MIPLAFSKSGERYEVVSFARPGWNFANRLINMGIYPGKVVEVINNVGHGPILLKVDEFRVAIGRGMAMRIMVRKI